jgi:uncharacterized coiled-coil protein SlyX
MQVSRLEESLESFRDTQQSLIDEMSQVLTEEYVELADERDAVSNGRESSPS